MTHGLPPGLVAALFLAAALAPLALAALSGEPPEALPTELGIGLGLAALALMVLQFAHSGRFETLSGRIGSDRTLRLHRAAALPVFVPSRCCTLSPSSSRPCSPLWALGGATLAAFRQAAPGDRGGGLGLSRPPRRALAHPPSAWPALPDVAGAARGARFCRRRVRGRACAVGWAMQARGRLSGPSGSRGWASRSVPSSGPGVSNRRSPPGSAGGWPACGGSATALGSSC